MLWIKTAICSHTSATVAGWHTVRNPVRADAPAFDARLARLTVSASHSLLRSSALHSMAVTGPFRHAQARFGMRQSDAQVVPDLLQVLLHFLGVVARIALGDRMGNLLKVHS